YGDFTTITRTKTLTAPTNLGARIYTTARELLDKIPPGPLRLIGVQLSGLSDVRVAMQESLFGDAEPDARGPKALPQPSRAKLERATEGIDKLRRKFGRSAVVRAS